MACDMKEKSKDDVNDSKNLDALLREHAMHAHSEKVDRLLREGPDELVTWNTVVMVIVFFALFFAVAFVEYPHSRGESILQHLIWGDS